MSKRIVLDLVDSDEEEPVQKATPSPVRQGLRPKQRALKVIPRQYWVLNIVFSIFF